MLFIIFSFIFILITTLLVKRFNFANPYSKGFSLAIALSILAVVCLAQNFNHSLITEANDGIGISNLIAYSVIGEDGWSHEKFRYAYQQSIHITVILIVTYPIVLIVESKLRK